MSSLTKDGDSVFFPETKPRKGARKNPKKINKYYFLPSKLLHNLSGSFCSFFEKMYILF